ncbi:dynamin family protein [Flavobacterium piscisymbiosum]|uniref:Dynamin family protein n=1 Tax=Flavobacterium piscisymbiosum TaxID=2893753 RepID=A0ABS8MDS2_9FLAO|nr:dynamin family protein [Flavobacterium sp. F-30]MCC9063604.1 dynamin family protein [Flavobacterium sp. F-30]
MNLETIIIILVFLGAFVICLIIKCKKNQKELNCDAQNKELLNFDEIKRLNVQLVEIQKENLKLESKINNCNFQGSLKLNVDNEYIKGEVSQNIEDKEFEKEVVVGTNTDYETKYSKNIQSLKDEIEELEEDIKSLNSKVKIAKSENDVLSNQVYYLKKAKHNLEDENDELIKSNIQHVEQFKADQSSLTFINDILTAENVSTDDFENISKKTLVIVSHLKNEVRNCLLEIDRNIQHPSDEECDYWRNLELKDWIKNKKVIGIVGEFSSGKTSIINRILLQDDPEAVPLPVNSKETTAIPTYISKGIDFNCHFYSPSGELKKITKKTFESLTKSELDKINISSLIKYFVVSYNNPRLENISIVDTPGFGSNSNDVIKRTVDVVKDCDALFWVIDPNAGALNQSSLTVIKNHLDSIPLYLIINKCDNKSPADLDITQKEIEETIKKNEIKINGIIRFSNKYDVVGLMELISQVRGRKHLGIIKEVLNEVDKLIKENTSTLKKELNQQKIYSNEEDAIKYKLKRIEKDVQYSAGNIEQLVKFETSFWSKDYFRIEKNDHSEFELNLSSISELSSTITKESENHSVLIKKQAESNERISIIKSQLKKLQSAKTNFIKTVEIYNPNLLI